MQDTGIKEYGIQIFDIKVTLYQKLTIFKNLESKKLIKAIKSIIAFKRKILCSRIYSQAD